MRELDTDKIITMMVGREMKNLFPREPHEIGDVMFEARNVTCCDPINAERKRRRRRLVRAAARRNPRRRRAGRCRAHGADCRLFGYWRGATRARSVWTASEITRQEPVDAVRAGICMVPEDRKRHGIVPLMAVGHNITLAVLGRFAHIGRIDADAELAVIQAEIKRLKIKPRIRCCRSPACRAATSRRPCWTRCC